MAMDVYDKLRRKGYLLAGDLDDLGQRASVYYHMYKDSGGRNVFPLIAAHGALWASGFVRKGMLVGKILASRHWIKKSQYQSNIAALEELVNSILDINRKVCAEAYALYFYTKIYREAPKDHSDIQFSSSLIDALVACHQSNSSSTPFSQNQRWNLYHEFFVWEQENIVGSLVESAYNSFDCPVVRFLALRPRVDFAYFGCGNSLKFRDFSSQSERIEKGMKAYMRAEEVGLKWVAESLKRYGVLPKAFFQDSGSYYGDLERYCETQLNVVI
ncbi:hypothetical protein [Hahella ganghwensis]|uniref:hypothetical protein n=1 Tax=Hahella ganghwensis TaxID=286420 RepID=UPI00038176B3|nr:hypothetical protein [Hahella ganghwensis]